MLRHLDDLLERGALDRPAYEARRIEVLELIRRGAAIEYTPAERASRVMTGLAVSAVGLLVLALAPFPFSWIGVIVLSAGMTMTVRRLRE